MICILLGWNFRKIEKKKVKIWQCEHVLHLLIQWAWVLIFIKCDTEVAFASVKSFTLGLVFPSANAIL